MGSIDISGLIMALASAFAGESFREYLDVKPVDGVLMALISLRIVSSSGLLDFYESSSAFSGEINDNLCYMLDYGTELFGVRVSDYCPVG